MSLSQELKKLDISCLQSLSSNAKECIVLGDLQTKLDASLYFFASIEPSFEGKFFAKYEVGSEEGVLALLLESFVVKHDAKLDEFLDTLDSGYISAECSVGEEEVEELKDKLKGKKVYLYICKDLEHHEKAHNIAKLISMLGFYCELTLVYEGLSEDVKGKEVLIADEIEELESFDGAIVYFGRGDENLLLGSRQFALSNKLQNEDRVLVKTKNGEFERSFKIDESLKGTVGFLLKETKSYAYELAKINKVSL